MGLQRSGEVGKGDCRAETGEECARTCLHGGHMSMNRVVV